MGAVDADMVLVAKGGIARSTRFAPSSAGLALVNLTVPRASRSFRASLAGLTFQSSGMRPSLIAFFSASALRCLEAATIVASMIWPPVASRKS